MCTSPSAYIQLQHMAWVQVQAWRCRGKVPLGVDMTAALLEVQLLDLALASSQSCTQPPAPALPFSASEHSLRNSYAMVLVRCAAPALQNTSCLPTYPPPPGCKLLAAPPLPSPPCRMLNGVSAPTPPTL